MRIWLTRKKQNTTPSTGEPDATEGWLHPESVQTLLAVPSRQQLIQFIRQSTALPASLFERFWLIPIHRFAELAQLFPASENHHHAHAGGLLDHSLEAACYAARLRQNYLFPSDAAPEDQAAQSERWTTVIIYAALLHDLGKLITDIEVENISGKHWFPWHGPLTQPYRFRYLPQRDYLRHPAAAALLLIQLLPRKASTGSPPTLLRYPPCCTALTDNISMPGLPGSWYRKPTGRRWHSISAAIRLKLFIARKPRCRSKLSPPCTTCWRMSSGSTTQTAALTAG